MELLKKHKLALEKNSKAVLDSTEVEEIEKIEVILPLHALIVYRQLVAKDLALLHHQMNQDKEKSKTSKKVSNFFRNHFGSKKKSEEDESLDEHDISLQTVSKLSVCRNVILFFKNSCSTNLKMSCNLLTWMLIPSH